MFKNMGLVILCDKFLNPNFKMTTIFAKLARTTASTSEFICQERLQIIRNRVFILKTTLNFEWIRNQLNVKFFLTKFFAKFRKIYDTFPNFLLILSYTGTFNYDLAHFLCDLDYYSCIDTFSFVSKIKNANLSGKFLISYDVTILFTNIPLQETIDIAINLIFSYNPNLNITKKELKNFSFLLYHRLTFFLTVNFIIKLMEQPWILPSLLSLIIFSCFFTNLNGK